MNFRTDGPAEIGITPWDEFISAKTDEWTSLAKRADPPPDITPQWLRTVVETRQLETKNIWVAWASMDGKRCLVWPFMKTARWKFGIRMRILEPLQNLECHHANVLYNPDVGSPAALILRALKFAPFSWDFVEIGRLDRESALAKDLKRFAASTGFRVVTRATHMGSPYLEITGSWEHYLASRSANFRQNIKRRLKRAETAGQLEIRTYTSANSKEYFDLVMEIEPHTWKHSEGTSLAAQPWELEHYKRSVIFSDSTVVWVGFVLFSNAVPLAHYMALSHAGTLYGTKHSYREDYDHIAPGHVLTAHILKWAHDQQYKFVDMLGIAEAHKLLWTKTLRDHHISKIYSRGLVGSILGLYDSFRP